MDTDEPTEAFSGLYIFDSRKHTGGALLDLGVDQLCTPQDNHLEVWNDPRAKFRAFE